MDICNRHMNEIAAGIDASSVKHGDPRGLIFLMPYTFCSFLMPLVKLLCLFLKQIVLIQQNKNWMS